MFRQEGQRLPEREASPPDPDWLSETLCSCSGVCRETERRLLSMLTHAHTHTHSLIWRQNTGGKVTRGSKPSFTGSFHLDFPTHTHTVQYANITGEAPEEFKHPATMWGWNRGRGRRSTCSRGFIAPAECLPRYLPGNHLLFLSIVSSVTLKWSSVLLHSMLQSLQTGFHSSSSSSLPLFPALLGLTPITLSITRRFGWLQRRI